MFLSTKRLVPQSCKFLLLTTMVPTLTIGWGTRYLTETHRVSRTNSKSMLTQVWYIYFGNTGCWVFQAGRGYKIWNNQHTQRKVFNFENCCNRGASKSAKIALSKSIVVCLLLKWCPIFDSSPLHQFSKFNNFLWVCWFLVFRQKSF